MGAHFQALTEGVLMAPLDPRYKFDLISSLFKCDSFSTEVKTISQNVLLPFHVFQFGDRPVPRIVAGQESDIATKEPVPSGTLHIGNHV